MLQKTENFQNWGIGKFIGTQILFGCAEKRGREQKFKFSVNGFCKN